MKLCERLETGAWATLVVASVVFVNCVPAAEIRPSKFEPVPAEQEQAELLAGALQSQEAVFEQLNAWKGTGELGETFVAADVPALRPAERGDIGARDADVPRLAGPYEVHRQSQVEFLWSRELRSLRALHEPRSQTTCKDLSTGRVYRIDEDLRINCLLRPDGFYRFEPNKIFKDFEGFTPRSKSSRVVERLPNRDVESARNFSYLFDPMTMYELLGARIDEFMSRRIASVDSGRLTVGRDEYGNLLLVNRFSFGSDADGADSLVVEVVLDAEYDFMPTALAVKEGDAIRQSSTWKYEKRNGISLPTKLAVDKFGKDGSRTARRVMSVSQSDVSPEIDEEAFSLSRIGMRDDDRLIDRIENQLMIAESDELVLLDDGGRTAKPWGLLIFAGLALAVLSGLFFVSRFGQWRSANT